MGGVPFVGVVALLSFAVVISSPLGSLTEPDYSKTARSADVMVGQAHFDDVQRLIRSAGLTSTVTIENVQKVLDKDFNERRREKRSVQPDVTNTYLKHNEINDFLARVQSTATAADVTMGSLGQSFEGRDTQYVTITQKTAGGTKRDKYLIVIDAGIHAREWIAPAMALNIINKLAFNPDNDTDVAEMLEKFDWVVAPSINPDGYEYSHESRYTRLWRKTRTTKHHSYCRGVDPNRNFGFDWNPAVGGSSDPCSDIYAGPRAFSEPETENVRQWLTNMRNRAKLYLTLHAYGQYMLYPYGSDENRRREDEDLLVEVANAFANVLNSKGRRYSVGNSAGLLYPAAGGADDYAKGELGISLSYTPELAPGADDPKVQTDWRVGFMLPKRKIKSVADDTWEGLKAMARRVFDEYDNATDDDDVSSRSDWDGWDDIFDEWNDDAFGDD
ncbi:hypothetical protein BaRGS_00011078 [Batillaria attramentaria]|uniref:Peptidase M14 domain-containing protein n=1 Tax=Batillaria attramentaria TaxID=370345 RepID=A0ABD0LEN4_9CAEN